MDELNKIIEALYKERDQLFRFFVLFSRFEYSLKRSDFLKNGRRAKPDWNKYSASLQGSFDKVQSQEFKDAVEFLQKEPPRTQVVSRGDLDWKDNPGMTKEEHLEKYVLSLVRTVRNNLFHGGKYLIPLGPVVDVARNKKLVESATTILIKCLEISPSVRERFKWT